MILEDELIELAVEGVVVFERSGTRVKKKRLSTEAAARRSLEKRVSALEKLGYLEDGTVEAPRPVTEADTRAQEAEEGRVLFDELVPQFVAAWEAEGFDFTRTFLEEGRVSKRTAFELTTKCLELASATFKVHFARQQGWVDEEHGGPNRPFGVSRNDLAGFYRSPARIAAIAREKLRGRLRRDDGFAQPDPSWDWGGDELLVRLRSARRR
jgi:hypothetical protein